MKKTNEQNYRTKKGVVGDFFDFLFTAFIGIFLLLFLGITLLASTKAVDEQVETKIEVFKVGESFVNAFCIQMNKGANFEEVDLGLKSSSLSELLQGP